MFDIGATELLLIAIVAIVIIGPKDMPLALRTAGRWVGKMRRVSSQFRAGFDAMVREAELEEMEKEWKEKNRRIMAEHADAEALPASEETRAMVDDGPQMEPLNPPAATPEPKTGPAPADNDKPAT